MSFKPLDFLKVAVESRNISNIRAAISSYITKNPGNKDTELNEVLKYISNNQLDSELWEKHVVRSEETQNKDQWSKDYFRLIRSNLRSNFSMIRMKHILEVGEYLYKDEVQSNNNLRVSNKTTSGKGERRVNRSVENKQIFKDKVIVEWDIMGINITIKKKSKVVGEKRITKR